MKILITLTLSLFLFSCGSSGSGDEMPLMDAMEGGVAPMEAKQSLSRATDQDGPAMEKKVVKTGNLNFQVDNLESAYTEITSKMSTYDAYVENESQSTYGDRSQYSMTIRVPSEKFDALFNALVASSKFVENRSINLRDVTEQYYDLETRIKNKKVLEERYLELLERATSIKDLLEIENNLNNIRTEIEMLQGQFNYLSKQVSYSIIHLNFYEVLPYQYQPESRPGLGDRLMISLDRGWTLFISFVFGLIRLWPFLLVITITVIFLVRRRRRKSS